MERKKNNALETSPVDECSGKKWLNAKFNDFDFLLGFVHYAFSNMHTAMCVCTHNCRRAIIKKGTHSMPDLLPALRYM